MEMTMEYRTRFTLGTGLTGAAVRQPELTGGHADSRSTFWLGKRADLYGSAVPGPPKIPESRIKLPVDPAGKGPYLYNLLR
jgi:hypothetical protein